MTGLFMADLNLDRMKIFIVGPTESILTKRGNRHPSLAKFLVEQEYELEYVTSNFYHSEKRWFSCEEVRTASQQASYKLTVLKCLGYKKNISLRRILSNILLSISVFFYLLLRLNKNTILILPSRPVEMIFAAAMLRLLRGTSVALDIQDIWPDMLVIRSQVKRFLFTLYCNIYLHMSLRFIDKFFHVAPSFTNWLARYAPNANSIFVPLGFDAERWTMISQNNNKVCSRPINLVCVGLLQFQINVMPILEAIKGREDYHLTIIGDDGDGERFPEVLDFINEHALTNVTLKGRVVPSEMGNYLNEMDIGVVPMISSSIPNKVFDYLASYLPILVLGDGDSATFVSVNKIGWAVPYTKEGVLSFFDTTSPLDIQNKSLNTINVREKYDRKYLFSEVANLIK
jgi:hypothetical protein